MSANDTTDTTAEPAYKPEEPLGEAIAHIDVDQETYERVHQAYLDAKDHGYDGQFPLFAFNHLSTNYVVEVDGEPVDPEAELDE